MLFKGRISPQSHRCKLISRVSLERQANIILPQITIRHTEGSIKCLIYSQSDILFSANRQFGHLPEALWVIKGYPKIGQATWLCFLCSSSLEAAELSNKNRRWVFAVLLNKLMLFLNSTRHETYPSQQLWRSRYC